MTNGEQDREIRLMRRAITRIDKSVACIKQAVCGNGTRGLDERVTDLEKSGKEKPARFLARLMAQVAVVVAVLKGLDLLARAFRWW